MMKLGYIAIGMFVFVFLSIEAFAMPSGISTGSAGIAAVHQEQRAPASAAMISLEGTLNCINNGQACTPTVTDKKTGRTYQLSSSQELNELILGGAKNVAIQGVLKNADTIQISSIQALN